MTSWLARFGALALLWTVLGVGTLAAQSTARWYIGTYSNELLVWDEASEQVVDRIQMRNPIPRNITVAESRNRLYVSEATAQTIEIVDVARGEVVDEFTLSHDSVRVRIQGFAVHPSGGRAVLEIMRYISHADRYPVDGPHLVEYDLQAKEVRDTISLPDDLDPGDVNYR
jgi:hypothetical protein